MRLVRLASAVLLLSYAPLVAVGLADPEANPIGLGLLAMLGTAVTLVLLAAALVRGLGAAILRGPRGDREARSREDSAAGR